MNLKPEELVKALRRCANGESEECPFTERGVCGCPEMSADQIERDQKEIEALKAKVEQYRALIPSWVIPMTPKEDADGTPNL